MKIILFANGSSENHGCEAIKKGTMQILGSHKYKVSTTNIVYENKCDGVEYIQYTFKKKYTLLQRIFCRLKLLKNPKGRLQLEQFRAYFRDCDLALSVGGDNYCYGDSDWLYYLHNLAKQQGKPTILWGVSVEKDLIDEKMLKDFQMFDKIFVRESISYQTLAEQGLKNIIQCPDPAFALPTIKPDCFDEGFLDGKKYIGLNVSPLIERKEIQPGILRKNIQELIDDILNNSEYDILLIPHVVASDNNDYEILKSIKEFYPTKRVVLIQDHPCEVLKYYISKCELFIASRTHASIAAYAHSIPTLVIGYSVKSKGIAKDLFGTEKNYVISIKDINHNSSLKNAYQWMIKNKEVIRLQLNDKMIEYRCQLDLLKDKVATII